MSDDDDDCTNKKSTNNNENNNNTHPCDVRHLEALGDGEAGSCKVGEVTADEEEVRELHGWMEGWRDRWMEGWMER